MARNRRYEDGKQFPVTVPSGVVSGDPIVVGTLPGVAVVDRRSDGTATCDFAGVYDLSVKGHDGTANAPIAEGATIYYNSGATPKLNVQVAGVRFGYALTPVVSGATTTIPVKIGY
jgi:predicted RecA/RadA family phage recombinase